MNWSSNFAVLRRQHSDALTNITIAPLTSLTGNEEPTIVTVKEGRANVKLMLLLGNAL